MKIIHAIETIVFVMNLQLFADAGTLVNATGNFVNAYDGNTTAFDPAHTMDGELKAFYDTELLENARVELFYAQFAKKQTLPKKHGKTVEWRKWNTFAKASKLQEGVIPTGQKFGMSSKTGSIDQYGTYAAVTDILELRAYDDVILGATEEMGASAAETQETLIRDALLVNTNVLYCDNINVADGVVENTPTAPNAMEATTTVMSTFTPDMVAKAVTIMKKNRVPSINGKYYAVIHPSVAYDLRKSKEWIEAHKYAKPEEIYNGEIGEIHGCRFIENVFAPILDGEYANKASGVTYATYMFGKDAFGIIDPEGGALEMIVKDKSQVGGPLNQFSTIGYKFETNGATILYPERVLRIMSCSSYSATDEAN
ncbi:MAG: N4-gp56 family major capsid protein [Ruminococcus sp.]|jgi:N4-gp56 family major capsid protein|nr:N4-gp56 family major capsid protein [Ruminococcus sp.]